MDAEVQTETTATAAPVSPDHLENGTFEWAVVEIFGHRRHAGRSREEERFGSKMLRIDIPIKGDIAANGWETHYYGGASIFSYTLTDHATVMRINTPYSAAARFSLPSPDNSGDEPHTGSDDDDEF